MPIAGNLETWLAGLSLAPGRAGPGPDPEARRRPGLLALDVSKRALGVAGADAGWRLATALTTIRRTSWLKDLEQLQAVIRERRAGALVVGWPLNMDDSEGPRCQSVRALAERLDGELGLPILLWDERLSTFAAEEAADQANLRGRQRAARLDALAAAAILQDALDALARVEARARTERPKPA